MSLANLSVDIQYPTYFFIPLTSSSLYLTLLIPSLFSRIFSFNAHCASLICFTPHIAPHISSLLFLLIGFYMISTLYIYT